jgi:hypothetical protein
LAAGKDAYPAHNDRAVIGVNVGDASLLNDEIEPLHTDNLWLICG